MLSLICVNVIDRLFMVLITREIMLNFQAFGVSRYFISTRKMFSKIYSRTADVKDEKITQFLVGTDNGFLPRQVNR